MLFHYWGLRLAAIAAVAALLGACRSFTPDGGMNTVAFVAGSGLDKDVVKVASTGDAVAARARVQRLLQAPLGADAAVQIALLNNQGLQAAYNRLGIAEAVAVKASRPPGLSLAFSSVSTPVELDIERQIIASLLSLLTMPARTRIAGEQFAAAELVAAQETLRLAAETRRAYLSAVAAREIAAALGEVKRSAEAGVTLAEDLRRTGAVNRLDLARRQAFATELDAEVAAARLKASAAAERLTRLLGLWQPDLAAYLPSALAPLPGSLRSAGAIEQEALDRRIDIAVAKAEMQALARSYGLSRKTHFLNALDVAGISKTQKEIGEKRANGGGYELALEVPLFDFGRANVREAEQRYLEAAHLLGEKGINAASEAREAYRAYSATYAIARKYESEVLPLQQTISSETELQYNAMQVDAFALLEAARAKARARVASIEAKRDFWLAAADLSVAVLGGGTVASGAGVMAAPASPRGAAAH
jgi:outer membrane protein TolC